MANSPSPGYYPPPPAAHYGPPPPAYAYGGGQCWQLRQLPSQGRIRGGRHGQLPQIPGTLQIERSLAPTRRPLVCSCTAALLIADYEEMGFLEPAPRPRLPVALLLMRLDQACEELCFL